MVHGVSHFYCICASDDHYRLSALELDRCYNYVICMCYLLDLENVLHVCAMFFYLVCMVASSYLNYQSFARNSYHLMIH